MFLSVRLGVYPDGRMEIVFLLKFKLIMDFLAKHLGANPV